MATPLTGLMVRGVLYTTLKDAAAAVPCNPQQITEYKREKNCTAQDALDYFVQRRDELTFEGKLWKSAKEYIESKGLDYISVYGYRRRNKCSWEEAITAITSGKTYPTALPDGTGCSVQEFLRYHTIPVVRFYRTAKDLNLDGAGLANKCRMDSVLLASLKRREEEPACKTLSHQTNKAGELVYMVECMICGRNLKVSAEERKSFVHSDEFCSSHEYVRIRPPITYSKERYTVGDSTNLSLRAASALAHVSDVTLKRAHKDTGRPFQELLTEAYEKWNADKGPWVVHGVECHTRRQCSELLGIAETTFSYTATKLSFTTQQTIDYYLSKATSTSKYTEAERRFAKEVGLSPRLSTDMVKTLGSEQAVRDYIARYPKMFEGRVNSKWRDAPLWECYIGGERYYTYEDIASATGLSVVTLQGYFSERAGGETMQAVVDRVISSRTAREKNGTLFFNKWTDEERDLLCAEYETKGANIESLRKRHSISSIRTLANKLGLVYKGIPEGAWTEFELQLLREYYPKLGTDIPQLQETRSPRSILNKAQRLGLKTNEDFGKHLMFEGKAVSYRQLRDKLGIMTFTVRDVAKRLGCDEQTALDRIASCFIRQDDGTYFRTAVQFTQDERKYVHIGGNRWSISKYCEVHSLSYESVIRLVYNGKSADEAVAEVIPGWSAESSTYVLGQLTPAGMRTEKVITCRDGLTRYQTECPVCHNKVILTRAEFISFEHSHTFCTEHSLTGPYELD